MNDYLGPFERMVETLFPPPVVRAVEAGGAIDPLWSALSDSGFLDALVPGDAGGAGLPLSDVGALWQVLGRHAVPLPVGETMIARALLAGAGIPAPPGPIALATVYAAPDVIVPCGIVATHVLLDSAGALHLVEVTGRNRLATGVVSSLAASMRIGGSWGSGLGSAPDGGLRAAAALLRAALIAGAAEAVTKMTAAYARERNQFGKPIAGQQALQQQMAVMAEDMVACRIAAQLGCSGSFPPGPEAVAVAKSVTSSAAARLAATAHAVHGAIGISEEYDLQLFSRRLHEWRLADGSETWWNRRLGAARLGANRRSVDYVRDRLSVGAGRG